MKIFTIGTTAYKAKMELHKKELKLEGHEVVIPAFDDKPLDEVGVCEYNLTAIKDADEIHIFWDQRSTGTIFDFGMCFALRKPIKIIYIQKKTFRNLMEKYENQLTNRCP